MKNIMPLRLTLLLVIGFLTLTHNCYGQALESRFIVHLGHFTQPFMSETVIRCAGTLVSETHILCTASCVTVQSPAEIAINIKVVTLLPNGGNTSSSRLVPAGGVFIHPFYDHNQYTNNAAIVTTDTFRLNPHLGFAPRSLGSLSTSTPCNLFGWGKELLDQRRDEVMINGPVACDPKYPQSYCTVFDSVSNSTCDAMQGSPLTCGNDMTVAGFVITDGGCSTDTGRSMLNYHSIHDFRDWIVGVLGPKLPARNAVNFIVTVLEQNETSIPRCFGTIIASNRVLTTAACATIDSSSFLELLVQTKIVEGSSSSSSSYWTSQIYIHPYYSQENPLENNVAVIEISGSFDRRIVPRTLGNLQHNSSCQLFGWGPTNIGFTRGDQINVIGPQLCEPNQNTQAFCSIHPSIFHYSCNAMTGSPVTCGGNESVVAGFLINNATCNSKNGRASLRYHSVSEFTDWIMNPTNQRNHQNQQNQRSKSVSTKVSALFVFVSILLSSLFN